jgi:hypothetical protein
LKRKRVGDRNRFQSPLLVEPVRHGLVGVHTEERLAAPKLPRVEEAEVHTLTGESFDDATGALDSVTGR